MTYGVRTGRLGPAIVLGLLGACFLACSSSSSGGSNVDGGACFPDNDGLSGGSYTFDLTVDDTGFSKMVLASQNEAMVTLTLKNTGTKPHGFVVGCTDVSSVYPELPKGCSSMACFPAGASIAPLDPGESKTITFDTPVPDGLIWPFKSSEPADANVPGLNDGQWSLM